MQTPEDKSNVLPGRLPNLCYIADYEICEDDAQLHSVMDTINRNQYQLISVTQDSNDVFRVFFRRVILSERGVAY